VGALLEIGICDDQKECTETLRSLLNGYLEKKQLDAHITVFTSAEDLLQADWQGFHILFLDIVMGKQDGIQAAVQIRRRNPDVSLIFVSAFLDYATMGYQVKASAYILKSQLSNNMEKVMDAVLMDRNLNQNTIEITVDDCVVSLPLHQIEYVESRGRIAIFHGEIEYHTHMCFHMRFSDIEAILSGKGFLRIHKCYIVNPAHCITIKNYQAILGNGTMLPCSRQDYSGLVRSLMRWKGKNL
jgi:DNA-binding LytR/AlgR family response regulator